MASVLAQASASPRVAVVGLGSCGLTTLKNLREAGFDAVGYDRNDYVGGLWKFSTENKTTVLRTTVANGTKQFSCYTDFPFPDSLPNYAPADQYAKYLEDYAKTFGLMEHVRLGLAVDKIARNSTDDLWEVRFRHVRKQPEEIEIHTFDKVVLCHGLQVQEPNVPKIDGLEMFKGPAIHSNQYKGPEPFEGKNVVVVGMGNTGPDVACDLVGHASKIYLSHRQGHAVMSRKREGKPLDHLISLRRTIIGGIFNKHLPTLAQWSAVAGMKFLQNKNWKIKPEWNLKAIPSPVRGSATMNDELVPYLHAGKIVSLPGLRRCDGNTLEMYDSSHVADVDAIVFCTGHRASYSVIDAPADPCRNTRKDWPTLKGANGRPLPRLYQGMFSLDYPDSLAILGTSPFSPQAFMNYDICSMAVAQIWKGNSSLPPIEEMNQHVDAHHEAVCKIARTGDLFNVNFRNNWDWFKWADEAAGLGIVKRTGYGAEGWRFWASDRKLYGQMMDGVLSPHIMRLFDEGKRKPWEGARLAMEKANGL